MPYEAILEGGAVLAVCVGLLFMIKFLTNNLNKTIEEGFLMINKTLEVKFEELKKSEEASKNASELQTKITIIGQKQIMINHFSIISKYLEDFSNEDIQKTKMAYDEIQKTLLEQSELMTEYMKHGSV